VKLWMLEGLWLACGFGIGFCIGMVYYAEFMIS
jgi:hypothetical protein